MPKGQFKDGLPSTPSINGFSYTYLLFHSGMKASVVIQLLQSAFHLYVLESFTAN